jgi:ankyrin repeat protein
MMFNVHDDLIIIEIFKKLDVQSAVQFASTSKKNHEIFKNNESILFEVYLKRDFPHAASTLKDEDFKRAYIRSYRELKSSITNFGSLLKYILESSRKYTNTDKLKTLYQKIHLITNKTTLQESLQLHRELHSAIIDKDIRDQSNCTPIMAATVEGKTELVRILIEAGVDVNAISPYSYSLLHYAVSHDCVAIVESLIRAKANVNVQDGCGNTPLRTASARGNVEIVNMLIKAGADLNLEDDLGSTPMSTAAYMGQTQTLRLLIEAGAKVDHLDRRGNTPLLGAITDNHLDAIQLLIQAGAKTNIRNNFGINPLAKARGYGHAEIVKLLERVGHFRSTVKPVLMMAVEAFEWRRKRVAHNQNSAQTSKPPAVI